MKAYHEIREEAKESIKNKILNDSQKNKVLGKIVDYISGYQLPEHLYEPYQNLDIVDYEVFKEISVVKALRTCLSEKYQRLFDYYMKHLSQMNASEVTYGSTRSFKTKYCYNDIKNIYNIYITFVIYDYMSFDIIDYFNGKKYFEHYSNSIDDKIITSFLLSQERDPILKIVKEMVYENEGIKNISYDLIRGIMRSNDQEIIEVVMDLLKAAKLSEGLRQSIIENIDFGSIETYKYFLKYIRDENLIRFSSVKRSFISFTGLEYYIDSNGIDKVGPYVMTCLLDNQQEDFLKSDNGLKFYIGLYAMACEEFYNALNYIEDHIESMPPYKQAIAIFFITASKMNIPSEIVTNVLNTTIDKNSVMAILDRMPNVTFKDKDSKRKYVEALLKAEKMYKRSDKYSLFLDTTTTKESNFKWLYTNHLLKLVEELNAYYQEAFAIFEKHYLFYTNQGYQIKSLENPYVREVIVKGLGSNNADMRTYSKKIIEALEIALTREEYELISDFMKSKRSDTRRIISEQFLKANGSIVIDISMKLLNSKNKNMQEGGLSIFADNFDRVKSLKGYESLVNLVEDKAFDESVHSLKEKVLGIKTEVKPLFFDKDKPFDLEKIEYDQSFVDEFLKFKGEKFKKYVEEWYKIFMTHQGEEVVYKYFNDSTVVKIVGYDCLYIYSDYKSDDYTNYLFYDEYIKYADEMDLKEIVLYAWMGELCGQYNRAISRSYSQEEFKLLNYYMENKYIPDLRKVFESFTEDGINKIINFNNIMQMIKQYLKQVKSIDVNESTKSIFLNLGFYYVEKERQSLKLGNFEPFMMNKVYEDNKYINKGKKIIFSHNVQLRNHIFSDVVKRADEKAFKNFVRHLIQLYGENTLPFEWLHLINFNEEAIIDENELYQILFCANTITESSFNDKRMSDFLRNASRGLSGKNTRMLKDLNNEALMEAVYKKIIDYMLPIELERTETDTLYSKALSNACIFYNADTFLKALSKMGNMPFVRGYCWSGSGKKVSFSNIIANTIPEDDLVQEDFDKLVKDYKISKERLLEAGMYNLRFIDYIESNLKYKGLKKAAYFFKAHMNDSLEEHEKIIIRRYSDIDFVDFKNGQMDIDWFKESYKALGKTKFEKVYEASKYMTEGANHKRAQYFSDAVLGKLKLKEVEEKISDKRNQNMILAYGLLPLRGNKENAALKRYKKLQLFIKESKQYGAQRRQSEALKVSIAMNNLARNFGVDASRFSLMMESKIIDKVKTYFDEKAILLGKDEYKVYLSIEDAQNPEILVFKNDKKLKSLPSKLKKDKYVKSLIEVKKTLKEQYKRAKFYFEESMINEEQYTIDDINMLMNHPVIKQIFSEILFVNEKGEIGFVAEKTLKGMDACYPIDDVSILQIAHPSHFVKKDWIKWQQFIMSNSIKQPIKQVFREYYTLTKDELDNNGYTNRFAGYQIEGKKMYGILQSRGWIINDYEGFEKINHKSNLRIDLYAYADWFTPNDVEQPTIEKITFINNKTNKAMDMKTLSPILFSETMRDLDLVISVAYVGGVDPVYAHTTIDMRKRILEHNLSLFNLSNYEMTDHHIIIKGDFGKYSVHLGSGIIHMEGKGMLPVFPVHSQHRGHIFLPFVDDDLKSSEIITKVLMLCEDKKIKDPSVLMHIK